MRITALKSQTSMEIAPPENGYHFQSKSVEKESMSRCSETTAPSICIGRRKAEWRYLRNSTLLNGARLFARSAAPGRREAIESASAAMPS